MNKFVLTLSLGAVFGSSAFAQILIGPGGSTALPANTPVGAGVVIDANATNFTGLDFFGTVVFTGYMETFVIRRPNSRLTFAYRFVNLGGGLADPIERVTMTNFAGWSTAVAQDRALALGLPTISADTADRSANARTVGFTFNNSVNPGENSAYLFIDTDAIAYKPGAVAVINGGVANVPSFAPAVPEPASMTALALGAAALIRRRRTR